MAEETVNGQDNRASVGEEQAIQVGVLAQYVKDLSFENPGAPGNLAEERFGVDRKITARAHRDEQTVSLSELVYSGIFGARNMPDEAVQPFLLIECPRILFPFARRIIADVTRDGGFPPLLLEPIDFAALYRQHLLQQQRQQQEGAANDQPVN